MYRKGQVWSCPERRSKTSKRVRDCTVIDNYLYICLNFNTVDRMICGKHKSIASAM